jgi:hypothetical protein
MKRCIPQGIGTAPLSEAQCEWAEDVIAAARTLRLPQIHVLRDLGLTNVDLNDAIIGRVPSS